MDTHQPVVMPAVTPIPSVPALSVPVLLPEIPAPIAKAMGEVNRQVRRLKRDGDNKAQGFKFASIDAFLETVGGWCADAGLIIVPEEVEANRVVIGTFKNRYGEEKDEVVLRCVYRFWLIHESGVIWQHPMLRRIELQALGAQSYGSAESYVLKRFLRALFKVPTGDALDPASDVADPDAQPRKPARGDGIDGLERPTAGPPPGVTAAREKPRRADNPEARQAPTPAPDGPPDGSPPFRVFNGLGEVVSEWSELKPWGAAIKKHLGAFPASWDRNAGEIARLRRHFLDDPSLTDKARASITSAFDSIAALKPKVPGAPPEPAPEPDHDPETGEVHETSTEG